MQKSRKSAQLAKMPPHAAVQAGYCPKIIARRPESRVCQAHRLSFSVFWNSVCQIQIILQLLKKFVLIWNTLKLLL